MYNPLYVEDDMPFRDQTMLLHRVQTVVGITSAIVNGIPVAPSYRSYLLLYDEQGNRMRQQRLSRDGRITHDWQYDDFGKLLEELNYDLAGNLNYRFQFLYQGDYWYEKHMFDGRGRMHYRIAAERAADGMLLKANYYEAGESSVRSDVYLYNSSRLLLEVRLGEAGKRLFTYDSAGDLQTRSTDRAGASIFGDTDELAYDSRRLVSRFTHLHESETSFEYAFF